MEGGRSSKGKEGFILGIESWALRTGEVRGKGTAAAVMRVGVVWRETGGVFGAKEGRDGMHEREGRRTLRKGSERRRARV